MIYEVTPEEAKRAKQPHELFLINLIFNHILLFIAALSASSLQQSVVVIPIISVGILSYTLWRAKRSIGRDPWFVMCHWQVAARRSLVFILMLAVLATLSGLAWAGQAYAGMMREAAYAIVGGLGILPTMVSVIILVILESDAMHQARHGQLPQWVVERHAPPTPAVGVQGA